MGRLTFLVALSALALAAAPAEARGLFGSHAARPAAAPAVDTAVADAAVAQTQQALDEQRLSDAGEILDRAMATGLTDPRLVLLSGELYLARGEYESAVTSFSAARSTPALLARASAGLGIAQAGLGRSPEAVAALREAVAADTAQWRAWNALGVEYDRQKNWTQAEEAYAHALQSPGAGAMVYNNRGYSRMLQGRYDEASADFVTALARDPGFAVARTNLRLALAVRGDYDRATAASGAEDRAAVLNNAGFAAMMRGDLPQAKDLFQQAIAARGKFYGKAQENLELAEGLIAQKTTAAMPAGQP
ncbi:MAG: tetratricopeptide repeat protein [Parcubacteria group bacterium]